MVVNRCRRCKGSRFVVYTNKGSIKKDPCIYCNGKGWIRTTDNNKETEVKDNAILESKAETPTTDKQPTKL
jgi:hypothetical protein